MLDLYARQREGNALKKEDEIRDLCRRKNQHSGVGANMPPDNRRPGNPGDLVGDEEEQSIFAIVDAFPYRVSRFSCRTPV